MSGHSLLPWSISPAAAWDIKAADGQSVGLAYGAQTSGGRNADAAFIVLACNAHDDLVTVAKLIDDGWTSDFPDGPDMKLREGCNFSDETLAIWRAARAALAKAGAA